MFLRCGYSILFMVCVVANIMLETHTTHTHTHTARGWEVGGGGVI